LYLILSKNWGDWTPSLDLKKKKKNYRVSTFKPIASTFDDFTLYH